MADHDEVEVTFLADLDLDLSEALARVEGDVRGVRARPAAEPFSLEATYYDTVDLRLARAGLTLRRRVGGDDEGWHLKVPAGEDTRAEVQLPLSRARKSVPAPLRRMVWARSLGDPLAPVARIETHRTAYLLVDPDDVAMLEVVDDHVVATRLRPRADDPPGGGADEPAEKAEQWREIEVEIKLGSAELLAQVVASMKQYGLEVAGGASRSKVLRTLDLPPEPAPDVLSESSSAGEVVMAYVDHQVEQILASEALVRLDRPDSIHAMRVGTRRLRSTLKTYRPLFDAGVTEPLRSEATWLAGVLGNARDAEVQLERARTWEAGDRARDVEPSAVDQVVQRLADAHGAEYARVLQQLDSDRYLALVTSLTALVEQPPLSRRALRPARDVLPGRARRAYRALRRSVDVAAKASPAARDGALHEVRKNAKRLRYAAQAAAPALGKPAVRCARMMEQIQDELGEHQDSVVMRGLLRQWALDSGSAELAFACGRGDAREEQRALDAEAAFDTSWSSLQKRKKKLLGWMR